MHARQPKQTLSLILGGLVLSLPVPSAFAQVVTAITPSGLNTAVSAPTVVPSGQINYDITGGTRPGGGANLFHSFGDLSLAPNTIANFLNNTNTPTTNILSRVTGGHPSNIFGTLQTTGFGAANLFLINPAGVIVGPTASLNVGGSVHVSTANAVTLADGTRFTAVPGPHDTLLTMAPVESFGFMGSNLPSGHAGMITVQPGATLTVPTGQTLSLIGRDNPLGVGQTAGVAITGGTLNAEAGRIHLVSVGKPQSPTTGGAVHAADGSLSAMSGFKHLGTVLVTDGASINASASGGIANVLPGGTVVIRGGQLAVENSSVTVNSDGYGSSRAGAIDIYTNAVTLDQATLSATARYNRAGQIRFMGLETLSSTNSFLTANSNGSFIPGDTRGSIIVGSSATKSIELTSTGMTTQTERRASLIPGVDNPGITLTARDVRLHGSWLDASAGPHEGRPGGPITLNGETITLNQAELISRDNSGGGGAGTILVQGLRSTAATPTLARRVTIDHSTLRTSSVHPSPGGTITFHADTVTLNNATLSAYAGGQGGTLNLGDIRTFKSTSSRLDAGSYAIGSGGAIMLGSSATKSITLQDTTLSVRAGNPNHLTTLDGGTITIMASQHVKSLGSTFDASSALRNGGSVSIRAGHLSLIDSTVNALGASPGQNGTIQFEFGKTLRVQESVVTPAATIVSGWQAP